MMTIIIIVQLSLMPTTLFRQNANDINVIYHNEDERKNINRTSNAPIVFSF